MEKNQTKGPKHRLKVRQLPKDKRVPSIRAECGMALPEALSARSWRFKWGIENKSEKSRNARLAHLQKAAVLHRPS